METTTRKVFIVEALVGTEWQKIGPIADPDEWLRLMSQFMLKEPGPSITYRVLDGTTVVIEIALRG